MLTVWVYNDRTKKFKDFSVKEDDRSYNSQCYEHNHEFPPGSSSCACGKYTNLRPRRRSKR